jgi:epoxyqueuosine reductase
LAQALWQTSKRQAHGLINIIKKFEHDNNVLIGVCDNSILNFKINKKTPFVSYTLAERTNPLLAFDKTKSIIVMATPYGKRLNFVPDNKKRAQISISAAGQDYHTKSRALLEKLMAEINQKTNYKIFVDTGPLNERALAKKAGLGFIGKNCSLITEKFGSFVFLGYALIDIFITPTQPAISGSCGSCNLCIEACPTKALSNNGMDPYICASYLTQSKQEIPERLKKGMHYIYGCDICQNACPKNNGKYISEINNIDLVMPEFKFLKSLTGKQFKEIYGGTAMFWRGKKTIMRNVGILEKNEDIH